MTLSTSLQSSIAETFHQIRKHYLLFAALIIMQLLFFAALYTVSVMFILPIMQSASTVMEKPDSLFQDADMQNGMPDFSGDLQQARDEAMKVASGMFYWLLSVLLLAVIFNSILWSLTLNMHRKRTVKHFFIYLQRFAFMSLLAALLFLLIFYFSIKAVSVDLAEKSSAITGFNFFLLAIMVAILYFAMASYILIDKYPIRKSIKLLYSLAIKNIHYALIAFAASIALIGLALWLLAASIDMDILLMLSAFLLFTIAFAIARMFYVNVLEKVKL